MPPAPAQSLHEVWEAAEAELRRLVAALGAGPQRDDVLQDVYLAALRDKAARDLPAVEQRRWLFRVAINRCRLEHRRTATWRRVFEGLWNWRTVGPGHKVPSDDAARACAALDERALVRDALETLEPDLKTPLVLRYFFELDSAEIGRVMQLPDSTVRSRLRAARKKLAQRLTDAGYEPEK